MDARIGDTQKLLSPRMHPMDFDVRAGVRLTAFNHQDEFIRVVTLHPRSNSHIKSPYGSNELRKMHPMDGA